MFLVVNLAYANNLEINLSKEIRNITKIKIKQEIEEWSTRHQILNSKNKIKIIFPEQINTLPKCEKQILVKKNKGQEGISRQMYFNAYCQLPKWKLVYKANVLLNVKLPVLKNSVRKGDILLSTNIKLKWFNISFFERDFVSNLEYLIKKEATRYIAENMIINTHQVQEKILIHAGDLIKIKAVSSTFDIAIDGVALTSGHLNKPIKVKAINSHRQFIAYPVREGVATVKIN